MRSTTEKSLGKAMPFKVVLERKGSFFRERLGEVRKGGGDVCQQPKEGIVVLSKKGVTESLLPPKAAGPVQSDRGLRIQPGPGKVRFLAQCGRDRAAGPRDDSQVQVLPMRARACS